MNFISFLTSSIGKKSIMSVTGAMLGGFLLAHLAGNSTMFFGREALIAYAEHLHSLGLLIHLAEVGLVIIFTLHVYFALQLYFENIQARPTRYAVNRSSGGKTFASQTMPYTGVIIFIFVVIHLGQFHFTDHSISIADIVRNNLRNPITSVYYILSLLALATHVSHGFWSLFQSLGINHPRYDSFLRQGAIIVSVLGGALYIAIPVITSLFSNFLL